MAQCGQRLWLIRAVIKFLKTIQGMTINARFSVPSQSEVDPHTAEADPVAIWRARQALQGEIGSQLSGDQFALAAEDQAIHLLAVYYVIDVSIWGGFSKRKRCPCCSRTKF